MTKKESDFQESQGATCDFVYPEDEDPQATADRLRQLAGEFAFDILRHYKPRVAMIKLAALQHLTAVEKEPVGKVAEDLGVSRQFFNRVKAAIGVSLRLFQSKTP